MKSYRKHTAGNHLLIAVFIIFSQFIKAQDKPGGSISGEVRDVVTKQPLAYANIIIDGTSFGTASDSRGYFTIKNVSPGVFQVKASFIGYEQMVKTDVSVSQNRNTTLYFDLQPVLVQTGEVSVKGNYFQKPADNATSFRSLSPQEIRRSPGSGEDIFRVMQSLPGVASAGGKSAQLIVRGGSPEENLTLLDNIEIYNPIHFARTGESMGIISIINPSLLKSVDFMTGGYPAKYGDKMSSVFEMSLIEGNMETNNLDLNANVAGFGTTFDGPVPGNGTAVFSLRRGFFDLLTKLFGRPAAPRYYDAVGKVTYDLDDKNRLSILGFYYLDQISREGSVKGMSGSALSKYDYLTRNDYGTAFGLNWRSLFSRNAYALTTLSLAGNGWNTKQGTETDRALRNEDIYENNYSLKNEITWQIFPGLDFKTGGELKVLDSKHVITRPEDTTRSGQIIPASSVSYLPKSSTKLSLFLQDTYRPVSFLTFSTGLRYDRFSFTGEANFSPRVSLSYSLTEKTFLNASYGIFYQTPALYQIALDPLNRQLKSSRAEHYIAGIEHLFTGDTRASVELYYKNLSNVVVENDTSDILNNNGSGLAKGIEFSLQKKFTGGFVASASYAYSVSRRRDFNGQPLYYFEYDRPHIVNLIFGMELSESWQIGAKFQYAAGSPYTPVAGTIMKKGTYYVVNGEFNSARYPDYHKLDIRVDRKFSFNGWTLSAYLDLWNIYNRQNVLSYSYKVDSSGSLTKNIRTDFGILPILGVTAQF
ncbi:MAG TPA: TonB-dependent receptor [Ignavibacteriales bacterium]|nr:TonB-dependent receptor [Ignavibacteriales bacterium]